MVIKVVFQLLVLLGFILTGFYVDTFHNQTLSFAVVFGGVIILIGSFGLGQKSKEGVEKKFKEQEALVSKLLREKYNEK